MPVWWKQILFCIIVLFFIAVNCQDFQIVKETRVDCQDSNSYSSFYDISQLKCVRCAQTSQFQVQSADGLRCQCRNGFKLTQDFGGTEIECEECPLDHVTGQNPWECVACSPTQDVNICPCEDDNSIAVERLLNGSWPTGNIFERSANGSWVNGTETRECTQCVETTVPNAEGTRCVRCNQVLSLPTQNDCVCPLENKAGGLCFETEAELDFDTIYTVSFEGTSVESAWLKQHLKGVIVICGENYYNITACQILANMCTMILFQSDPAQGRDGNACAAYNRLWQERTDGSNPQPPLPELLYEEASEDIVKDQGITTEFTFPNMSINFQVAMFSYNGSFLGISGVTNGLLQLCENSKDYLDAAYTFGTQYSQSCSLRIQDLLDKETTLYDLYLQFEAEGVDRLYPIPVRVINYPDNVNEGSDTSEWVLTRRFLLVDNVIGRKSNSGSGSDDIKDDPSSDPGLYAQPVRIRYASSMTFTIELQDDQTQGRIYPPLLTIEYKDAEVADVESKVDISFKVEYLMNIDKYNNDIAISVGVLSALAIIYSVVQTWGWNKRAGQLAIDFLTLIKFLIFFCGNLANVFFVVTFGSAIWWWIFYKQQNTVLWILPSTAQENQFVAFLGSAFALKSLQLISMIFTQVTVDIFFVDWERSHGKKVASNDATQKGQESAVSIWRTYFVANEWNELQTLRKINQIFQVFCVIFFLHVVGFENLATNDPLSQFSFTEGEYRSKDSRILRYAIGSLAYILIAVTQWIFYTFIYERFIEDKVRQYVDLCSMSNVSVFIMENKLFGHYIHGRSVHGRADTGVREMAENMKREEEDLCGKRGLIPNTDHQTFQMALPRKLRSQYDKVMMPITMPQQGPATGGRGAGAGGGSGTGNIDPHTDRCVQSYSIINRFMQAFVDHSLKDIDYFVTDKNLLENIMDVEFQDTTQKGHFYNDSGHGFDQVLFFGQEMTLTIFELLFFSVVDLIAQNFVLAAVLTYVMSELIAMIRDSLGRNNLAKKTLVDKRFLI